MCIFAFAEASIFNNRWAMAIEHSEYLDYVLVGLGMLLGLIVCFLGYRLFKPVLFIAGFIVGAGVLFYALWFYTKVGLAVLIVAPILCGIVLGIFFIFVAMAGIFFLGSVLGFLLFCMVVGSTDGGLIHDQTYIWVGMGASSLVGGVLALIFQKKLIITATSFAGAYAVVIGADRYAKGGFSHVIPQLIGSNHELIDATYRTYIEIGACVVLCIIGMYVQFRHTGKNCYHKPSAHSNEEDGYFALNE